jgi:hypothetical protein
MSKIKNLKTLSGNTINLIDMLEMLCPIKKTKYIEILYRITKSNSKENKSYYDEIKTSCIKEYGVSEEKINELNDFQLIIFYSFIERLFYSKNMVNFKRFCELNELGLIKQNDLTKYSSFDEINNQVNVAELKIVDKEMEKEVIKIYEDDEWLLVKPLTYFSSKKYGSNTKWCTTSDDDPEYFKRYSREGVLIYIINKFTVIKVGSYNEIS